MPEEGGGVCEVAVGGGELTVVIAGLRESAYQTCGVVRAWVGR